MPHVGVPAKGSPPKPVTEFWRGAPTRVRVLVGCPNPFQDFGGVTEEGRETVRGKFTLKGNKRIEIMLHRSN